MGADRCALHHRSLDGPFEDELGMAHHILIDGRVRPDENAERVAPGPTLILEESIVKIVSNVIPSPRF